MTENESNAKLIQLVSDIINDTINEQSDLRKTLYPNYEDYYDGDQLTASTDDPQSEQKVFNVCRPKVGAVAAICTDKQPMVEMVPRTGQNPQQAAIASLVMDWIWGQARLADRVGLLHHDSVKMGTAFEEAIWLPNANGVGGRPWGRLHSPRYAFWDNGAACPDEQRWSGFWRWMPKGEIKRMYPKFDTKPNVRHFGISDDTVDGVSTDTIEGKVLLVCLYLRPSAYYYRKDWTIPDGMMKVVIAGKQVLEHKRIGAATRDMPLVPFRFQPQANKIEGVSLLHDLMDIQDCINNLMHIMQRTCELGGIPWAEIRQAIYDKLGDKLTNEFLQWVPVSRPGDIQVHEGIGFPPEMLALLRELYTAADRVTLFRDVSEAMARGTRMSGRGIRAAQEVNLSALRRTIREYENSIRMLGMIHFHNFIDNNGFAQIRVQREEQQETLQQMGPREGQQEIGAYTMVPISAADIEGSWEMKVVVSPAPPMGQVAYREQVLAEMSVGVRDARSAMEALAIPGWREILQRQGEAQKAEQDWEREKIMLGQLSKRQGAKGGQGAR